MLAQLPAACSHVYLVRIDSDDMYAPDAIEQIRRLQGAARCSQFYRGYVFDVATQEIRRVALRSPPFYSIRFSREEIESGRALGALLSGRGHGAVRDALDPVALPDARFCILRHGTGIPGRMISGQRVTGLNARREILGRFGLMDDRLPATTPIEPHGGSAEHCVPRGRL